MARIGFPCRPSAAWCACCGRKSMRSRPASTSRPRTSPQTAQARRRAACRRRPSFWVGPAVRTWTLPVSGRTTTGPPRLGLIAVVLVAPVVVVANVAVVIVVVVVAGSDLDHVHGTAVMAIAAVRVVGAQGREGVVTVRVVVREAGRRHVRQRGAEEQSPDEAREHRTA